MSETVLVVAAHPDDEVLGCGGAIARHIGLGDEVHIMIMAEGIASRDTSGNGREDDLDKLAQSAHAAAKVLGAASLGLNDFPDNRMDGVELLDVIKVVEQQLTALSPTIVYTHHAGDLNVDHRVVNNAVMTACRPEPGQSVRQVLCFEVPSSTEWNSPSANTAFTPQYFVDISEHLKTKLDALNAYKSEMRPWPHPRSIEAVTHLARGRGASGGCEAAEAFMVGRMLA